LVPQNIRFICRQLKHEIRGEPPEVSFDGAVERLGLDSVQQGQIAIQHHLFAANQVNSLFNSFDEDEVCVAQCEVLPS